MAISGVHLHLLCAFRSLHAEHHTRLHVLCARCSLRAEKWRFPSSLTTLFVLIMGVAIVGGLAGLSRVHLHLSELMVSQRARSQWPPLPPQLPQLSPPPHPPPPLEPSPHSPPPHSRRRRRQRVHGAGPWRPPPRRCSEGSCRRRSTLGRPHRLRRRSIVENVRGATRCHREIGLRIPPLKVWTRVPSTWYSLSSPVAST